MSTVYNTYKKMNALVTKVQVINQASTDPSSNWAKARYCWVKQLAIRFGKIDIKKYRDPQEANNITTKSIDTCTESVTNIVTDNSNCVNTIHHNINSDVLPHACVWGNTSEHDNK